MEISSGRRGGALQCQDFDKINRTLELLEFNTKRSVSKSNPHKVSDDEGTASLHSREFQHFAGAEI